MRVPRGLVLVCWIAVSGLLLARSSHAEDERAQVICGMQGVVAGPDGTPAADASIRVWTSPVGMIGRSRAEVERAYEPDGLPRTPHTARTNAAGRWTIDGLTPGGHYRVEALAKNAATFAPTWVVAVDGVLRPVFLALQPAVLLAGRMLDPAGTGISAVVVASGPAGGDTSIWGANNAGGFQGWQRVFATTMEGHFAIQVPAGGRVALHVRRSVTDAPRRISVRAPRTEAERKDAARRIVIGPQPKGTLTGVIRDAAGAPVAGARIRVTARLRRGFAVLHNDVVHTLSDAEGRYRLVFQAGASVHAISVAKAGFAPARLPPRQPLGTAGGALLPADGPLEIDVTLLPGRSIAGRVLDGSGRPLEGAWVRFVRARSAWISHEDKPSTTRTDSSGSYRLVDLPLVAGFVVAGSPTHIHAADKTPPGATGIPVAAGGAKSIQGLKIVLRPSIQLRGRVLNGEGAPLRQAIVQTHWTRAVGPGAYYEAHVVSSDSEGWFVFPGLPSFLALDLHVEAPGYAKRTARVAGRTASLGTPPTIVLERAGQVSGTVVDARGTPMARMPITGGWARGSTATGYTNAHGRFTLLDVPPGRHSIICGQNGTTLATQTVEVTPGRHVEGLVFENTGTHVIAGTVVNEAGRPLARERVEIHAVHPGHGVGVVKTDAVGHFRITHLPPGKYTVHAGRPVARPPTVESGTENIRLVVATPKLDVLQGEVRLPSGDLVPSATVEVRYEGDGIGVIRHSLGVLAGRFSVGVPVGIASVTVSVSDPRDAYGRPLDVRFKPRRGVRIDAGVAILTMRPSVSLRGVVRAEDGSPVAGHPFRLTLPSDPSYGGYGGHTAETDAQGRFAFHGLEPRAYRLQSKGLPGWSVPKARMITAPRLNIELVLQRYKALRGRLLDDRGAPLAAIRVWAEAQWRHEGNPQPPRAPPGRRLGFQAHTDTEGRFTLEHLPPEYLYTVRFTLPTHLAATHFSPTLTRVEAGGAEAIVTLERGVSIRGRVVNPSGKGVAKLRVSSHGAPGPDGKHPATSNRTAQTDDDGAFHIGPFPHNVRVTLRVSLSAIQKRNGLPWLPIMVKDVPTNRTDVRIVVSRGVEVHGRLEGATAAALRGLYLRLESADGLRSQDLHLNGESTRFTFTGLQPGTYKLIISAPSRSRMRFASRSIEAPAADVVLKAIVRVHVRGRMTGVSAKGYSARFVPHEGRISRRSVALGLDGTFDLGTLDNQPGTLLITSRAKTHVVCLWLTPSDKRVAAKAVQTKRLEGRVVGLPGKIRRSTILARRGRVTFKGAIAEDGVFTFTGLPPGEWHLEVTAGRGERWTLKPKGAVRAGDLFVTIPWR